MILNRLDTMKHEELLTVRKYPILRVVCWLRTIWRTFVIAPPIGTWVDGHDYIDASGEVDQPGDVLQCVICRRIDDSQKRWRESIHG